MEDTEKLQSNSPPERVKPRWNSPAEIIAAIDQMRQEIDDCKTKGRQLDTEARIALNTNLYLRQMEGHKMAEEANAMWRHARYLETVKLPNLKEALAVLQTPELPGCQVMDKDGKPVTGIPR